MFPNMDAIGIALARLFEQVQRIADALVRIASSLETMNDYTRERDRDG